MPKKTAVAEKPKQKPISCYPVPAKNDKGKKTEPWAIMERLLKECREFDPIKLCRIRLFWQKSWKVDADGIATGAMVSKASEIDRNLVESSGGETPDVIIKIAEKVWPHLNDQGKERVIYHELCHIHPALDSLGEQKYDSKDRPLWRIGRHPVTAFAEEIARYGVDTVLGTNASIVDAGQAADAPLLAEAEKNARGVDKGTNG